MARQESIITGVDEDENNFRIHHVGKNDPRGIPGYQFCLDKEDISPDLIRTFGAAVIYDVIRTAKGQEAVFTEDPGLLVRSIQIGQFVVYENREP